MAITAANVLFMLDSSLWLFSDGGYQAEDHAAPDDQDDEAGEWVVHAVTSCLASQRHASATVKFGFCSNAGAR